MINNPLVRPTSEPSTVSLLLPLQLTLEIAYCGRLTSCLRRCTACGLGDLGGVVPLLRTFLQQVVFQLVKTKNIKPTNPKNPTKIWELVNDFCFFFLLRFVVLKNL